MLTFKGWELAADLITNPLFVLALIAWCSALLRDGREIGH